MNEPSITIGKLQGLEELNLLLGRFVSEAGKTSEDALRTVGRRLVVDLALATYPATEIGVKKMKGAISGGLNRIFHTTRKVWMSLMKIDRNLADAYWAHEVGNRKNHRKAEAVLKNTEYAGVPVRGQPDPTIHQSLRTGPRKHVLARKVRAIVPMNPLNRYQQKIFTHIGKSAAGWSVAAAAIRNTRGIPYFKSAKRHPGAVGRAVLLGGPNPKLILADDVPYVSQNLGQGTLSRALDSSERFLKNHLQLVLDAQAGKTLPRKRNNWTSGKYRYRPHRGR